MMVKRSSTPSPKVRGKPAELKTIDQLKATDRPADVAEKLRERGQHLLGKLEAARKGALILSEDMPGDASQLITDVISCERTVDVWMRDVTATATQIVEKYNDLQQDNLTLQTR